MAFPITERKGRNFNFFALKATSPRLIKSSDDFILEGIEPFCQFGISRIGKKTLCSVSSACRGEAFSEDWCLCGEKISFHAL